MIGKADDDDLRYRRYGFAYIKICLCGLISDIANGSDGEELVRPHASRCPPWINHALETGERTVACFEKTFLRPQHCSVAVQLRSYAAGDE